MHTRWIDDKEKFFELLELGHKWQIYVGKKLFERGFAVQVPRLRRRETIDQIQEFTRHDSDLLVGSWRRHFLVEIKSRAFRFTGPHDFPSSMPFVDTVNGWNRKKLEPVAIIQPSRVTGAMVVVPGSTQKHWTKVRNWDSLRQIWVNNYACPRELLKTFDDFCDWLEKICNK
jgi:hypothetical protein